MRGSILVVEICCGRERSLETFCRLLFEITRGGETCYAMVRGSELE